MSIVGMAWDYSRKKGQSRKRGQEPFAGNRPFGCFAQKAPDPFFRPEFGKTPVLREPVVAEITIRRKGQPTVVLLDHEGCPTSKTLAIPNGLVSIDGRRDRTMYYLISY